MKPISAATMTQFLAPTSLCDSDKAEVRDKARRLAGDSRDPTQAALAIFYFVRDEIRFGLNYPDAKASETLDRGTGFCMTKTNLQMALLRAAGVPSRCHLVQLPKEVNRAISPKFFFDRLPDLIVHPFCECYLGEGWIACDSVLDDAFYRGLIRSGHMTEADEPSIEWDGKADRIFGRRLVKADLGTFATWDEGLVEAQKRGGVPPRNRLLGPIVFAMANRRIRGIRMSAG